MRAVTAPAARLITFDVILTVLASGAVTLRIISKRIRQRPWQVHDFLCMLSLLCLIGYTIDIIIGAVHGGLGLHMTQLPLPTIVVALKVFFASEFFWSTGVASFRLAILLLYIEIFQRPAFFRAALATAVLVSLYYVACIPTVCLLCRPINYNWNKTIDGKCANTTAIELFSAAFNMVLDVWVVCLPLPIVWQLQMPNQKKIGISATFALGLVIAGINLGRLIQTIQCEMSTGILVACVPTLGPVFFPSRFGPGTKARYQCKDSRRTPFYNGSSGRTTFRGPASDLTDDRPFTTLEEDDIELKATLRMGNGYQVHAGRAGVLEKPDRHIDANEIGVRQDLHVFDTPIKG